MKYFTRFTLSLLCFLVVLVTVAPAYAEPSCPTTTLPRINPNMNRFEIGTCANRYTGINYESYEFTTKLVACMEGTIRQSVQSMMSVIATEFGWLTGGISTLVIIFYGIRIFTGEKDLLKRTSTLFIKLAFVTVFMNMLPDIVGWVFGVLDQVLMLVVGGMSPWQRIDIFLGNLVGFGPSIVLLNGLLGLVGAAVFSSNVGISLFASGIFAILNLLVFIMELVYTYLLAFLTIGFLLILMPIMIPLYLFFYTERYFKKWVDIIVSAILTPVLIFAFVWMFLGIFDILIQNIFDILGGNDFRAYWRLNTSIFSWVMPSDPNTNTIMQKLTTNLDVDCVHRSIKPPTQLNINPMAKNEFESGIGRMPTLNFGSNDVNIVQKLSFAFTSLYIFSSLMKSMVRLLPDIATSITGVMTNIAFGGNSTAISQLKGGLGKAQGSIESGGFKGNVNKNAASSFSSQMAGMLGNRDKK